MAIVMFSALAVVHLLGVVLSFVSLSARAVFLRDAHRAREGALARALMADNLWGISALVVLPTGLYRFFVAGKTTAFYLANPFMHAKLGLFGLVMLLELWPMVVLVRHRLANRTGSAVLDEKTCRRLGVISLVQLVLLSLMLIAAPLMARGVGQLAG